MNLIFEKETKYGIFKSSLNVKDDALPEEIEQIKSNLVSSWIEMIENPIKFNPAEHFEETYEILPEQDLIDEESNNG